MSEIIKNSKRPIIILGQSVLKIKSSKYIFNELRRFLEKNDKINNNWQSLNILSNNASTVGAYDLDLINPDNSENFTLKSIKDNEFDIIFLFGQDNLKFIKKNEFIIYVGSHGDRGAELADLVLPGSAYTEQDGYFTNLEGKIQKAYKASYPPGEAKEDWSIVNELANLIKRKKLFNDKNELNESMFNYLKSKKIKIARNSIKNEFLSEEILVEDIDYYYSNVISRASTTMTQCRNEKLNLKKNGTEG